MGQTILWVVSLALLGAVLPSEGTNAGLKGRITMKGLEYVRQAGIDALKSNVSKMTIADISGEQHVRFFGKVKYTLSGIKIQDLQLPNSAVKFIPGVGIQLDISDARIKVNGSCKVASWLSRDSGSVDVSGSGMSISAVLGLSRDAVGHPSVRVATCTASIGAINLRFFGGPSWLYNLFKWIVENKAQILFSSKLCPLISNTVDDLDRTLKTMQVSHQIDQFAGIDYALVNPPQITEQYVEGDFKGEFYSVNNPSAPPFSPAPFSLPDQSSQMVYFGISEYVANSASYVYFTAGNLHMKLTDRMLPKGSPIRLTTDSFKDLIPEVTQRYPHLPIILQISATERPMVTCLHENIDLAASGTLQAFAVKDNATMFPLFHLNLDINVAGQMRMSRSKLSASLDSKSLTLSLVHSDVGPFQVSSLQVFLNWMLQKVVLPKVNSPLSVGFPLPTFEGVTLVNPRITINKGYVLVATDVKLAM